jgi:hypothetical protein
VSGSSVWAKLRLVCGAVLPMKDDDLSLRVCVEVLIGTSGRLWA